MMVKTFVIGFLIIPVQIVFAQKKPLDHSVYDDWQSIGQKLISNDGKWVVYTIDPQEGDNELVIQSSDATYKKTVARGFNAVITEDSRFAIFRIRPFFNETREARIKKKKADELPKDSIAIVELGKDSVWKKPLLKGFKTPEKGFGWVAYQLEKMPGTKKILAANKETVDSLGRIIDSLKMVIEAFPKTKSRTKDDVPSKYLGPDTTITGIESLMDVGPEDSSATASADATADLWLRNLQTGEEKLFKNVAEYYFSKNGSKLLMEQSLELKDSLKTLVVLWYDLQKGFSDTLSRGGNDFKNFAISDDGSQVAYVAERDAGPKDLEKFFKLWYFKDGMDSAIALVAKTSVGMEIGMTVSEFANPEFSKSGKRLFFGVRPIQAPKDTSLVEIDLVHLDVWHYKDDYLQTVQLNRLQTDLKQSYLTVIDLENDSIVQLASPEIPIVYRTNEGDGEMFVGISDVGNRIESQWTNTTKKNIYAISVKNGETKLVKKDLVGVISPSYLSSTGKYIMWYDSKDKDYFVYDGDSAKNITSKIKVPLYDEEYDAPGDPSPYGVMGWHEGDSAVYIYDKYDIWKVNPQLPGTTYTLTANLGRKSKTSFRYLVLDPEKKFFTHADNLLLRTFNHLSKHNWFAILLFLNSSTRLVDAGASKYLISQVRKTRDGNEKYIYTKENFNAPPDLYVASLSARVSLAKFDTILGFQLHEDKLSSINPQQKNYNWGTAELYKWKTFQGKQAQGILYRPEDFSPSKKYPLILYFYEKLSDGLNTYHPPSPTPSRLNISFFVSRGYLVFAPDIEYTIGHPAKSAYDYIVSAAKDLAKHSWVDSDNIGIQGQSWGGLQVAQLITMTDMFKAAWAGAPVANMTSAYGGIRRETGLNRQFQYERTQSRIGATLWEKPNLYIENSPLFHLPKVKTPLVIMANDTDGAVPWYQGIELFTAMRRLNKKVWMLNYNGEAHNLIQRKNRKDLQIRQQQYFDWLLKGAKPAKWITDGVPAVKKGKDWGLEIVY